MKQGRHFTFRDQFFSCRWKDASSLRGPDFRNTPVERKQILNTWNIIYIIIVTVQKCRYAFSASSSFNNASDLVNGGFPTVLHSKKRCSILRKADHIFVQTDGRKIFFISRIRKIR